MSDSSFSLRTLAGAALCALAASGCNFFLDDVEVAPAPPSEGVPRFDVATEQNFPVSDASVETPAQGPVLVFNCDPIGAVDCEGRALQECIEVTTGSEWNTRQVCASSALCAKDLNACLQPECQQGELRCRDEVLESCGQERSRWDYVLDCFSAAYCDNEVERGCRASPCTVGETRCNDGTIQACNTDATGWDTLATCVSQGLCEQTLVAVDTVPPAGTLTCAEPVCSVGEVRCEGIEFQRCNSERTGWDVDSTCVTPALCSAGVVSGCQAPACLPAEHQCSGNGALEICNAAQNGYELKAQCINAAHCDPVSQECRDPDCDPGQRRCNGAQIEVCRQDRTGFQATGEASCATAALCRNEGNNNVRCQNPACVPGQHRCQGTGLERCNAGRTGFDRINTCETSELCSAAEQRCQQPLCRAGFHNCNGNSLRRCLPGRHAFENIANCAQAGGCNSEQGQCGDPCLLNQPRCRDNIVQVCPDEFTGWQNQAFCATADLCQQGLAQGGNCATPVCDPGDHICSGNQLQRCNSGRTGFETVQTCNGGQVCDAEGRQCDVCPAGQVTCRGADLFRCSDNGQFDIRSDTCPSSELCSVSQGRCLQCAPANSLSCQGNGNLLQCSSDQRSVSQIDQCGSSALCRTNGEGCLACETPGDRRCDGAAVLACVDGGNSESEVETCDSAALCVDDDRGLADCEGPVCQPNQFLCNEQGAVVRCNADLTGTEPTDTVCASAALCRNGACIEPVCEAGESRCEGNQVVTCNAARDEFSPTDTCASAALCEQVGTGAQCIVAVCDAGAIDCDGSTLRQCKQDRSGFEDGAQDCGSVELCEATLLNNPSATTCDECLDGQCSNGQSRSCSSGQLGAPLACAFGCNGNTCAECTDDACVNGVCFGNGCVECISDGDCPGSGDVCDDNVCAQCADDGDCGAAQGCQQAEVCSEGLCIGQGSVSDGTACEGGVCSAGACVGCIDDSSCPGQQDRCSEGVCVECLAVTDCPSPGVCQEASTCSAGTCVAGGSSPEGEACTGGVCSGGSCVGCVDNSQCGVSANECIADEVCDPATSQCVAGASLDGASCDNDGTCNNAGICVANSDPELPVEEEEPVPVETEAAAGP